MGSRLIISEIDFIKKDTPFDNSFSNIIYLHGNAFSDLNKIHKDYLDLYTDIYNSKWYNNSIFTVLDNEKKSLYSMSYNDIRKSVADGNEIENYYSPEAGVGIIKLGTLFDVIEDSSDAIVIIDDNVEYVNWFNIEDAIGLTTTCHILGGQLLKSMKGAFKGNNCIENISLRYLLALSIEDMSYAFSKSKFKRIYFSTAYREAKSNNISRNNYSKVIDMSFLCSECKAKIYWGKTSLLLCENMEYAFSSSIFDSLILLWSTTTNLYSLNGFLSGSKIIEVLRLGYVDDEFGTIDISGVTNFKYIFKNIQVNKKEVYFYMKDTLDVRLNCLIYKDKKCFNKYFLQAVSNLSCNIKDNDELYKVVQKRVVTDLESIDVDLAEIIDPVDFITLISSVTSD